MKARRLPERIGSYEEAVGFLYGRLPLYYRDKGQTRRRKANLDRMHALLEVLRNPQHRFAIVHIAGTNGKGTVAHMLAAMLQRSGMRTGLFTSPHYRDYAERIRLDGVPIPKEEVLRFVQKYRHQSLFKEANFFEWTLALGLDYFARAGVDVAVIETGLGGRLDSTNVVVPRLSIITNIGLDHAQVLGNTLKAIAREKAGIIKPNVPVVIGERNAEVDAVFEAVAQSQQAPIYYAQDIVDIRHIPTAEEHFDLWEFDRPVWMQHLQFYTSARGPFVEANLVTAIASFLVLKERYLLPNLDIARALKGMAHLSALTGYVGRWQVLCHQPHIIVDSSHNVHSLPRVFDFLQSRCRGRVHCIVGFVADKDWQALVHVLPSSAVYYFVRPAVIRGLEAETLYNYAHSIGLRGGAYGDFDRALNAALSSVGEGDCIFVTGSVFLAADALKRIACP